MHNSNRISIKRILGYSLIELSAVLMVMGLVTGTALKISANKTDITQNVDLLARFDAIDKALMSYRKTYNRLPCPARMNIAINEAVSPRFGVADTTNLGSCTDSAIGTDNEIVGGAVPVKTLGLPDSFAFDPWGRKIDYYVDRRITVVDAFKTYKPADTSIGNICVKFNSSTDACPSALGAPFKTIKGLVAIVSHGRNGHGGYQRVPGATLNAGSVNIGESENCGNRTDGTCSGFNRTLVQQPFTYNSANVNDTFDDFVLYRERVHYAGTTDSTTEDPAVDTSIFPADIVFTTSTGTYLNMYRQVGDSKFIKAKLPAELPPSAALGIDFSPDNVYMAVTFSTAPYLYIYKRSGDTYKRLAASSITGTALPVIPTKHLEFSPDGNYLAVGMTNDAATLRGIFIYKRTGDTFALLETQPTTNFYGTNSGGRMNAMAWSPNSTYIAATGLRNVAGNNNLIVYNVNTTTDVFSMGAQYSFGGQEIYAMDIDNENRIAMMRISDNTGTVQRFTAPSTLALVTNISNSSSRNMRALGGTYSNEFNYFTTVGFSNWVKTNTITFNKGFSNRYVEFPHNSGQASNSIVPWVAKWNSNDTLLAVASNTSNSYKSGIILYNISNNSNSGAILNQAYLASNFENFSNNLTVNSVAWVKDLNNCAQACIKSVTTNPQIITAPYRPGQTMRLVVRYDRPVTITGSPRIKAIIGQDTCWFTYQTGSGTNNITFRHILSNTPSATTCTSYAGALDDDKDGIDVIGPIDLNGGTITNSAINAKLNFIKPEDLNLQVKRFGPQVTEVILPPDGTYRSGEQISIIVKFDSELGGTWGNLNITFNSGIVSAGAYANGSNVLRFSYWILPGDFDNDGIVLSTTLIDSGLFDNAGNSPILTIPAVNASGIRIVGGEDIKIEKFDSPRVKKYSTGDSLIFDVDYLGDVSGGAGSYINFSIGASNRNANFLSQVASDKMRFSYTILSSDFLNGNSEIYVKKIVNAGSPIVGNPSGVIANTSIERSHIIGSINNNNLIAGISKSLFLATDNGIISYTYQNNARYYANDESLNVGGKAKSISFTPNYEYMIVGIDAPPYVAIRKSNADRSSYATVISSFPTNIPATAKLVRFSPDGSEVIIGYNQYPFISRWSRSGDVFTEVPFLNSVQGNSTIDGPPNAIDYSPDGKLIAIGLSGTNHSLEIFQTASSYYFGAGAPTNEGYVTIVQSPGGMSKVPVTALSFVENHSLFYSQLNGNNVVLNRTVGGSCWTCSDTFTVQRDLNFNCFPEVPFVTSIFRGRGSLETVGNCKYLISIYLANGEAGAYPTDHYFPVNSHPLSVIKNDYDYIMGYDQHPFLIASRQNYYSQFEQPFSIQPTSNVNEMAFNKMMPSNIYVVDSNNNRIQIFDISSKSYIGQIGCASGYCAPSSAPGRFSAPRSMNFDPAGNIWVADTGNNRVQKLDRNGNFLLQIGCASGACSTGTANGNFNSPYDLDSGLFNNDLMIFVSDRYNNRIQIFNSNGQYIGQFGQCSSGACAAGSGATQFDQTASVRVQENGFAIGFTVGDINNNRTCYGDYDFSTGSSTVSCSGSTFTIHGSTIPQSNVVNFNGIVYAGCGTPLATSCAPGSANGYFNNPGPIAVVEDLSSFYLNGTTTVNYNAYTYWVTDTGNNRVQIFFYDGRWPTYYNYESQLGCATGACPPSSVNGEFNGPTDIEFR